MTVDKPGGTPPRTRAARRAEAEDFVRLLRQIERQPELGHRLLRAIERLLSEDDPDLCIDLARRYSRRPIRSRAEAVLWVKRLHRLLLAAHRKH